MVGDYSSKDFFLYFRLNGQFVSTRFDGYPAQEYYSKNLYPKYTGSSELQITNSSKENLKRDFNQNPKDQRFS